MRRLSALLLLSGIVACADAPAEAPEEASPDSVAPTTIVDSILPIEEEIRRFKQEVGETASELEGGATSRDELVTEFVEALSARDTAALAQAVLNPAEFIDLYFPHTVYTRPPYQMDPAAIWFQMQNNSSRGLTRALNRYGGRPLELAGYSCADQPVIEGPNRVWEECVVRLGSGSSAEAIRLFGLILETDGRFKFVTYGNNL